MTLRPILLIIALVAAPLTAAAQSTNICDPSTTACPGSDSGAGVNMDP